ncbi:MAG: precorrin-6y C5,15-methyltransferase (decarboxylating) subunit CbiE [Betaproteobacteria bacterium]|nr:precorrin-6y C5,15-methyltransferase (decarboxylating) subunit CbiE [Betaproteobacteria bacterium]
MNTVSIVGILDDGWEGLAEPARRRLASADFVIGVGRTLERVGPQLAAGCEVRDMDGALTKAPEWIKAALAEGKSVAVLATGDPLCHGIASYLLDRLGGKNVEILPTPSTLQIACAHWKKPWHDIAIASCHGKDAGEWELGATPGHGLYPLMRAIALNRRVFAFTSPENGPARLARALLTAGYGVDGDAKLSVAARLLLPDEAVHVDLPVAAAAGMRFAEPCVVLVEHDADNAPRFGLEDVEYLQRTPEKGLITKQEARALSLAKLRLKPDAVAWDIGAGAGSVGLEAARLAPLGHVWAIEKNAADAAIARANAVKFRVGNYTLCEGKAPAHLDGWPDPDAVFIGGSGGELAELIRLALARLKPGGRLVMNFVTLENLATATAALKESGARWEVVQLQASRSQPILDLHRLAAQNPVWIVTAHKPTPQTFASLGFPLKGQETLGAARRVSKEST